jgi:hypothetical protein
MPKLKPPAAYGTHWPLGKRRHTDTGEWTPILVQLQAFFRALSSTLLSRRAASHQLGISERTLRRWIAGEDRPAPEDQDRVLGWLTRTRERLGLTGLPLSEPEARVMGRKTVNTVPVATEVPAAAPLKAEPPAATRKRYGLSTRQRKESHCGDRLLYIVLPAPPLRELVMGQVPAWIAEQLDIEDATIADYGIMTVRAFSARSHQPLGQICTEAEESRGLGEPVRVVRCLLGRGRAISLVHRGATVTRPQWPWQVR